MFLILASLLSFIFLRVDAIDVHTSSGLVRGNTIEVLNTSVNQFIGIPFAEPPIGELRFDRPKPILKPLPGVIDATKYKTSCWQNVNPGQHITVGEDCLYLNIWTKQVDSNSSVLKPVMFWIYGGALLAGTIFDDSFNGSVLATQDVVLVSTNYRLGAFGFLYGNESTAPGNLGFYDQNLALRWVHDNIHLFGGDKNQITIFGESAGSWSVSAHIISPMSKGLFKRAILQSGSLLSHQQNTSLRDHNADLSLKDAINYARLFNCTDENTWLSCMRNVDARSLASIPTLGVVFGSEFLPHSPQYSFHLDNFNKDLDIMAGICKDEGSVNQTSTTLDEFTKTIKLMTPDLNVTDVLDYYTRGIDTNDTEALKWKLIDFFGDIFLKCPTYQFAKQYYLKSQNKNIYFYELAHSANDPAIEKLIGVQHAADIAFTFGLRLLNESETDDNIKVSKAFVQHWTDFAKYGNPGKHWPKFFDYWQDTSNKDLIKTIKILNPKEDNVHHLLDQCDTLWQDYLISI